MSHSFTDLCGWVFLQSIPVWAKLAWQGSGRCEYADNVTTCFYFGAFGSDWCCYRAQRVTGEPDSLCKPPKKAEARQTSPHPIITGQSASPASITAEDDIQIYIFIKTYITGSYLLPNIWRQDSVALLSRRLNDPEWHIQKLLNTKACRSIVQE